MSRTAIPLVIDDVSSFAKRLRKELADKTDEINHTNFLSAIARAAGYKNHQHLKSLSTKLETVSDPMFQGRAIERASKCFDENGNLFRWPKQHSARLLALWAIWSKVPAKTPLSEPEVNALLKENASFGDHVLLRRLLVDTQLMTRTNDGSTYRRVEQSPPLQAAVLISEITRRQRPS